MEEEERKEKESACEERERRKRMKEKKNSFERKEKTPNSRQPAPRVLLDHRAQQRAPRAPALGEEGRVEVEANGDLLLLLLLREWRRRRRKLRLGGEEVLGLLLLLLLLLLLPSPAFPPRFRKVILLALDAGEHRVRRRRRCDVVEGCRGRK